MQNPRLPCNRFLQFRPEPEGNAADPLRDLTAIDSQPAKCFGFVSRYEPEPKDVLWFTSGILGEVIDIGRLG
jgi:hypothetical protein